MFTYNPARFPTRHWQITLGRVVSLLALLAGLWLWSSERSFIRSSSTTTGTVSGKIYSPASIAHNQYSHGERYDLDYKFTANGRDYSGNDSSDYDPGKAVTVYFNRYNPADSRLGLPDISVARNLTILGILFTLGLFPWRWLHAKLSRWRLA